MKKRNKLLIFTICAIYLSMLVGCNDVYAETVTFYNRREYNQAVDQLDKNCKAAQKALKGQEGTRYGIEFELTSLNINGKNRYAYKIEMKEDLLSRRLDSVKDHIKFEVASLKYTDSVTGDTSSETPNYYYRNSALTLANNIMYIQRPKTSDSDVVGFGTTEIILRSSGFTDPDLKAACSHTYIYVEKTTDSDGKVKEVEKARHESKAGAVNITLSSDDAGASSKTSPEYPQGAHNVQLNRTRLNDVDIDCSKAQTPNSFEAKYCEAMRGARSVSSPTSLQTFQCSKTELGSGSSYYTNKQKFYHTESIPYSTTYRYNYGCGPETVTASCTVKCTEVVTVEYGPPVASKAGLCFEYKVRVTSRVNCVANSNDITSDDPDRADGEPRPYVGYCTPTPVCTTGKFDEDIEDYNNQGGPDEDFDICINNCDGGKYTDKCTEKCYKEVYTPVPNKTTGREISFSDTLSTEPSAEKIYKNTTAYGYYCNTSNQIYWLNGKNNEFKTSKIDSLKENADKRVSINEAHSKEDPRWYWTASWGYKHSQCNRNKKSKKKFCRDIRYGCFKNTGIPCQCKCGEKCKWLGCRGKVYINPSYPAATGPDRDIQYLPGEGAADWYRNANAYNTLKEQCLSKSICSTKTSEYVIEVKYATSSNNQALSHSGTATLVGGEKNATPGAIIKDHGGCYDYEGRAEQRRSYLSEWSLPSTWISTKYGEVLYSKPADDSQYIERKGQFCLPFNAIDTNPLWWRYYYSEKNKETGATLNATTIAPATSRSSIYYDEFKRLCKEEWRVSKEEVDSWNPDYNINASAKNFGLFLWNFNVQCFYATSSNMFKETPNKRCLNTLDYTIRSIDLKQVFPDVEGKYVSDASKAGRSPGFNWTQFSINNLKDNQYMSNPVKYMEYIQTNGTRIYNKSNMDYDITLSREQIRMLKEKIEQNGLQFNNYGNISKDGNITTYKSTLLRSTLGLREKVNVPSETALKCNNMENVTSDKCINFD